MGVGVLHFLCKAFLFCHVIRESINYSSSETENVPTLVEDGDFPLLSTLTAAHTYVNLGK